MLPTRLWNEVSCWGSQGYSSVGRAAVSKTVGRGFESCCPCHFLNAVESESLFIEVAEPDRLDRFLATHLPEFSRTKLAQLIEGGHCLVNGKLEKPGCKLKVGNLVEVIDLPEPPVQDLTPIQMDLPVLFEDSDLLVVDKPRGLPTHPSTSYHGPTLVHGLLALSSLSTGTASYRPGIVHRLDKDTTGLLVVAKNDFAHERLAQQIAAKTAERRYVAIAYGEPEQERFRVEAPIARDPKSRLHMMCDPHGKHAATEFRRLRVAGSGTLMSCRLESGRTHQIRVHLQAIGHPVKGDSLYARGEWAAGPMQLHATLLSFVHPRSGESMTIYCQPPSDFEAEVSQADVE